MATVGTSITKILNVLQDQNKTNYQVPELSQYFNLAISYLSKELAKWGSRIGVSNSTLVYGVGIYSLALPSDFLALSTNENGEHRVFNATNGYARLGRGQPSDLDDWESETAANTGTPSTFVIDGVNMVIHPRAKVSTTVKFYYHPLKTIVDDSSTMPWSDWFNDPIEQFVTRQCRLRSEMTGMFQIDMMDYERLSVACKALLMLRENNLPSIGFASNFGWTE
jgi:hypothetical protein